MPPEVLDAIAQARTLQAEVEAGTARNVLPRARMCLAVFEGYCVGPAALERSAALRTVLAEQNVELPW